jgi:hypothetical protein
MNDDIGQSPEPPPRSKEQTVEYDVVREIRESLVATESVPQYIWQERVRGKVRKKFMEE